MVCKDPWPGPWCLPASPLTSLLTTFYSRLPPPGLGSLPALLGADPLPGLSPPHPLLHDCLLLGLYWLRRHFSERPQDILCKGNPTQHPPLSRWLFASQLELL